MTVADALDAPPGTPPAITEAFLADRQRILFDRVERVWQLRETGGPLFGFESAEDVVVIGAGGPGPEAHHRPRNFRPDRAAVDRAIARVQGSSRWRYRYLGTWHTHPFGRPRPSHTDIAAALGISQEPAVRLPQPILIIHATWPYRRTFRDRDLHAFRLAPAARTLLASELRMIVEDERRYVILDLDWDDVVA